jgi:hypothetical protein
MWRALVALLIDAVRCRSWDSAIRCGRPLGHTGAHMDWHGWGEW